MIQGWNVEAGWWVTHLSRKISCNDPSIPKIRLETLLNVQWQIFTSKLYIDKMNKMWNINVFVRNFRDMKHLFSFLTKMSAREAASRLQMEFFASTFLPQNFKTKRKLQHWHRLRLAWRSTFSKREFKVRYKSYLAFRVDTITASYSWRQWRNGTSGGP